MRQMVVIAAVLTAISCCCTDEKPAIEKLETSQKTVSNAEKPKEPEFGIVLLGDTGEGSQNQRDVSNAIEKFCETTHCSIGLLLGDNFYPKGVSNKEDPQFQEKFEDVYKNLKFKFYVVVGNHDAMGNKQAEADYKSDHWEMGGLYYSADGGWVDLYALDTNLSAFQAPRKGREQRAWLGQALPKSHAQWKIVFGHHPVYSSGFHGDSSLLKHYLKPMLQENKVDFYISGHDHDKEFIERDGVKYVVSGAGSKTRKIKPGKHTVFSKDSLGFAHLLLTKDTALLKFIDSQGAVEFERAYKKEFKNGKETTTEAVQASP